MSLGWSETGARIRRPQRIPEVAEQGRGVLEGGATGAHEQNLSQENSELCLEDTRTRNGSRRTRRRAGGQFRGEEEIRDC